MRSRLRFKPLGDKMIVTDDAGSWKLLTYEEFAKLFAAQDRIPGYEDTTFFVDKKTGSKHIEQFNRLYHRYPIGPARFVLKFTNACNYNCIYCQAGSCAQNATQMCTVETAKHVIDFMLQCKIPCPTLEIQGGEPLMNFPVIKEAVLYAEEKYGRDKINMCMMSNVSLMTKEIAEFCNKHHISVGSSIDAPKPIMDKQRPKVDGGSSYDATQAGRELVKEVCGYKPGFLSTITRDCLECPEEIAEMNFRDGANHYNCRSLFKLGRCIDIWDEIGYSAEEYLEYYRRVLMYCLDKTIKEDKCYFELRTIVYLMKIFYQQTCDIEVGSPCGGVVCMCSIDWNGDIMACEGSKMLGGQPVREDFVLGNVNDPNCNYHSVFFNEKTIRVMNKMVSQDDPKCSRCPYIPYCGRCAVERTQESDWSMFQCRINEGQLDIIFQLLDDPTYGPVLKRWGEYYKEDLRRD